MSIVNWVLFWRRRFRLRVRVDHDVRSTRRLRKRLRQKGRRYFSDRRLTPPQQLEVVALAQVVGTERGVGSRSTLHRYHDVRGVVEYHRIELAFTVGGQTVSDDDVVAALDRELGVLCGTLYRAELSFEHDFARGAPARRRTARGAGVNGGAPAAAPEPAAEPEIHVALPDYVDNGAAG